jgi:hypothetical protein
MNASNTAAVTRPLDLLSQNEVPPGGNGILHHVVQTPTALIDLLPGESVQVESFNAGRQEIKPTDGQSWAEALTGVAVPAKTYITIVGKNVGEEPRVLRATLQVEEQAQIVDARSVQAVQPQVQVVQPAQQPAQVQLHPQVQRQFGVSNAAPVTSNSVRSENTPFVLGGGARREPQVTMNAGVQSAQVENAPKRNVVRTKIAPLSERDPSIKAQASASRGMRPNGRPGARVNPPRVHASAERPTAAAANGTTVRTVYSRGAPPRVMQNGAQVSRAQSGAPRPANGPQNGARRAVVKAQPETVRTLREIFPGPSERAISLLGGHAERLLLRIEKHVFIPKAFKPAMVRALHEAIGRSGSRLAGGNDVVVCLSPEDIQAVILLVHHSGPSLPEPQRTRIANAIRLAFAVLRAEVVDGDRPKQEEDVAALAAV